MLIKLEKQKEKKPDLETLQGVTVPESAAQMETAPVHNMLVRRLMC